MKSKIHVIELMSLVCNSFFCSLFSLYLTIRCGLTLRDVRRRSLISVRWPAKHDGGGIL
jgi:hypothetical protein